MVDIITLELVRENLISAVQEMRVNLTRTAYSSILYEGEDFSCVIMDPDTQIVAMSKGRDNPIHIFPISVSMRTIQERFGDDINSGDLFLHNDTYTGGTHLNDIAMVYPVFLDDELFLLPVVRAHWADVGGMTYGSISGQATEVYQEGVRIPPIRIYDRGKPNEAALELLFSNMRIRGDREGDFRAMLGTCRMAEARVLQIAERFGKETLKESIRELLDRNERRMRQGIGRLPPGEYVHETYLEGGKTELQPLLMHLTLTVGKDRIAADFTGSSAQAPGPSNVGRGLLSTGVFVAAKSFLDPEADINHGSLRPIQVSAPEGTLVNCRLPAACGGSGEVTRTMEALAMAAMAPALEGKVTGDIKGGSNHVYVGGIDSNTGGPFVFYEYPAAGVGAFHGDDGNDVVRSYFENDTSSMQPIEAVELKYPLRVEHFGLREDSGGDGRWRGGLGCRRAIRLLSRDAQFSVLSDHNIIPPFGVRGGAPGAPNRFSVIREGEEVLPPSLPGKVSGFPLREGDLVLCQTSGGGGYGDPLDRDQQAVLQDVAEGYVTRERAERVYGVALEGDKVDPSATKARREQIKARPVALTVKPWQGAEYFGEARLWLLSPEAARRLDVAEGGLVEAANPHGAPLRGWVRIVPESIASGVACYLGPVGRRILRAQEGETVTLCSLRFEPEDIAQSVLPYLSWRGEIG
jgi:N-methylhydantoinase B